MCKYARPAGRWCDTLFKEWVKLPKTYKLLYRTERSERAPNRK